jgi:hypothetical protein
VNAILGGVSSFVKQKMSREGIYNEFITILQVCLLPLDFPPFSPTTSVDHFYAFLVQVPLKETDLVIAARIQHEVQRPERRKYRSLSAFRQNP